MILAHIARKPNGKFIIRAWFFSVLMWKTLERGHESWWWSPFEPGSEFDSLLAARMAWVDYKESMAKPKEPKFVEALK